MRQLDTADAHNASMLAPDNSISLKTVFAAESSEQADALERSTLRQRFLDHLCISGMTPSVRAVSHADPSTRCPPGVSVRI